MWCRNLTLRKRARRVRTSKTYGDSAVIYDLSTLTYLKIRTSPPTAVHACSGWLGRSTEQ